MIPIWTPRDGTSGRRVCRLRTSRWPVLALIDGDQETVLSCLHVILGEEWEHHRYAVRDLAAIEARPH
jgi:hypothetical protein